MFSFVTVNAYMQLGLLIVKCLLDYTYLSRQTNMPIGLAETVDPWCAGVRRWVFLMVHTALAFVSVVCRGRGDRSDPQVSFLAFSCSLHYFGPCLNMRYTRNILALEIWLGQ